MQGIEEMMPFLRRSTADHSGFLHKVAKGIFNLVTECRIACDHLIYDVIGQVGSFPVISMNQDSVVVHQHLVMK